MSPTPPAPEVTLLYRTVYPMPLLYWASLACLELGCASGAGTAETQLGDALATALSWPRLLSSLALVTAAWCCALCLRSFLSVWLFTDFRCAFMSFPAQPLPFSLSSPNYEAKWINSQLHL